MNTQQIAELHKQYVMPTYAPTKALVRGAGCHVWDADDREYLDFMAGISVCNLGHCHPTVTSALSSQAEKLVHVSNIFYNELQPELAKALSERSLGGKCFFCNSGAEANEALIKLARLWGNSSGRFEIVSMRQSFHGRTLATLTATGQDKVQTGFAPLPEGFRYAEFNNLESVKEAITEQTAAVLVETIQGEGGILPATQEFITGLRTLCNEKGILLLCDEVQAGIGRTGHWFGWQAYGIEPDVFSMAKALGNGFPIGAICAKPEFSEIFQPGHHATTFGGTPLACAAALAVIETIEKEELLKNAIEMGAYFRSKLEKLIAKSALFGEVRGKGLMMAIAMENGAADFCGKLAENGLLIILAGPKALRFLPPLNITKEDIDQAVTIFAKTLEEV